LYQLLPPEPVMKVLKRKGFKAFLLCSFALGKTLFYFVLGVLSHQLSQTYPPMMV